MSACIDTDERSQCLNECLKGYVYSITTSFKLLGSSFGPLPSILATQVTTPLSIVL